MVYLVAMATDEKSPYHTAAMNNPHVKQIAAMMRDDAVRYPDASSGYNWAFLRGIDRGAADEAAAIIRRTPRRIVEQKIARQLKPASANVAIEYCWLMQIMNSPQDGKSALAAVEALGVPMPPQP
jgi:hypothetical protein